MRGVQTETRGCVVVGVQTETRGCVVVGVQTETRGCVVGAWARRLEIGDVRD